MNVLIKYTEADTQRVKRQREEIVRQRQQVGGMVEVLQWIDAAARRQIKERRAKQRQAPEMHVLTEYINADTERLKRLRRQRSKNRRRCVWAPVVWQLCLGANHPSLGPINAN